MTEEEPHPRFRVRVTGSGPPAKTTRVRLPRLGGRYEGLPNVEFGRVLVRGVSFANMAFDYFEAEGTTFAGCDFSGARLHGTFGLLRQTRFTDCRFDRARLSLIEPGQARFDGCRFADSDMKRWAAEANEFVGCVFSGLVSEVNFWGRPPADWLDQLRPRREVNEFRGNDFRQAELMNLRFLGGIDLGAQLLPSSSEYIRLDRISERIRRIRPVVESWEDRDRDEGLILLDVYSREGYEDQPELFAHRWDLDVPREVANRVWALLEAA